MPLCPTSTYDITEFEGECERLIFRVTRKLAKKIKVVPTDALPPHVSPLLDWTANLFMVSRWQCILLTNSRCLYSVVLPGKGVSNEKRFVETSTKALYEYMVLDGCENIFNANIASHIGTATFCKASDRRVLGSMNDFAYHTRVYLLEMGLPGPFVNARLNDMPMSMLDTRYPKAALLTLASHPK